MNQYKRQKNKGFTIIEAMVAIFILSVSVSSMLGITASSATSARYANNEITANYLLQEAIDSIRNSRDTIAFQNKDGTGGWDNFLKRYGLSGGNNKCFSAAGCLLKMENFDASKTDDSSITACDSICNKLLYNDDPTKLFYNYTDGTESEFRRTVNMKTITINPDEVKVTAKIEWLNGDATIPRTQTLTVYLLNWQK